MKTSSGKGIISYKSNKKVCWGYIFPLPKKVEYEVAII